MTDPRAGLTALIVAWQADLRDALATPPPTRTGYCPQCDTDHPNEARLNRAVLFLELGRLKQLAAVVATLPLQLQQEEEDHSRVEPGATSPYRQELPRKPHREISHR